MALGDHGVGLLLHRRCPTCWLPTGGRDAVAQSACHHENEVDQGHDDECLPNTHFEVGGKNLHHLSGQGGADHGATTKAHDGHAGRHATAIGEPFDQGADRRDVTQAQANAADNPRAQQHHPKLMVVDTGRRNEHAAAPAKSADDTRFAWARPL